MSTAASPPRILVTGATGFIGGSALARLVNSTAPSIRAAPITCLVRGADRAAKLAAAYGDRVRPVVYSTFFFFSFFLFLIIPGIVSLHLIPISFLTGHASGIATLYLDELTNKSKQAT